MRKLLVPTLEVDHIDIIDFEHLHRRGYRNIILDIDNTIVTWNNHIATPDLYKRIQRIKDMGFEICLLSNNNSKARVQSLAQDLEVLFVHRAFKPLPWSFSLALKKLGGNIHDTLVIGDQIFTDILGGNLMGMSTILVQPISEKEFITTRFVRLLEKKIAGRSLKDEH